MINAKNKGEYLTQTCRFVLAEKLFLQGLEIIKNKLDEDRSEEDVVVLAELIGLFDDLYRVQNRNFRRELHCNTLNTNPSEVPEESFRKRFILQL